MTAGLGAPAAEGLDSNAATGVDIISHSADDRGSLQLFPVLAPEIESCLRASIQRFGVLVPVVRDQYGRTIDGHHRARLADELGVPYRVDVVRVADDDEARALARTLNADRRQLMPEQRREVAFAMRQDGHSYRAIAGALGVSEAQAHRDISGVTSVTPDGTAYVRGLDGKSYPARRPALVAAMDAREAEMATPALLRLPDESEAVLAARDLMRQDRSGEATRAFQMSESNEWYTPPAYLEAARTVMGEIDLDPASCAFANRAVKATRFFTAEDDGLSQDWVGRVWLNPPYGRTGGASNQGLWTQKLITEYDAGRCTAAVLLVNAVTDRSWFQPLWRFPICFTDHRIAFYAPDGAYGQPTHGNALVYLGDNEPAFIREFRPHGPIVRAIA